MSNPQQTVTTQIVDGSQDILIAPTEPDEFYMPYYDPDVVFGPWDYPDYPPDYWGAPDFIGAGILAAGIAYGARYGLRRWTQAGYWHGGFNWHGRNIHSGNDNNWVHDPVHRHGVRYGNPNVANRFAGNRAAITAGAPNRLEFRGRGPLPQAGAIGAAIGRANIGTAIGHPNIGAARPAFHGPANALGNISSGRAVGFEAARGRASLGGGFAHVGGGGGGGGGGARRSDLRLKHDVALLGYLDGGIGFYRFVYNGGTTAYVGVMAQEVATLRPDAVSHGRDGYLRVDYDRLGLKFQSYQQWMASGAALPAIAQAVR